MHRALNINSYHPHLGNDGNLVPWILWRLWKSRNEYIFKGKEYDAQAVVRRAQEDEEEWRLRKERQPQTHQLPNHGTRRIKWLPPPLDWVKCNTDGAWRPENSRCGLGWILRDHEKKVLWLGARALPIVNSVLEVELESLRWAVLSLIRLNYRQVIFETDSQQLVSLLRDESEKLQLEPIIADIKSLLQRFKGAKIVFTFREGNGVADKIAKESLSSSNYDSKLFSIMPDWIKPLVEADTM